VQDDLWSPDLRYHHASFHLEVQGFVADVLAALPPAQVPPTAVLDIARLTDGRFVVLEVNDVWSGGLYGCDPDAVVACVVAAATEPPHGGTWLWMPDPAALEMMRPGSPERSRNGAPPRRVGSGGSFRAAQ
jgi:hypothetical protein